MGNVYPECATWRHSLRVDMQLHSLCLMNHLCYVSLMHVLLRPWVLPVIAATFPVRSGISVSAIVSDVMISMLS